MASSKKGNRNSWGDQSAEQKSLFSKPHTTYSQEERAIRFAPNHYLNEVSDYGYFKRAAEDALDGDDRPDGRTRLFCCLNISDIRNIDPHDETFFVKARIYLLWQVDLASAGLSEFVEKAAAAGEKYNLATDEVKMFESAESTPNLDLPIVSFFNAVRVVPVDQNPSIRIYGGKMAKQTLMWNRGYTAICKEHFELENVSHMTSTAPLTICMYMYSNASSSLHAVHGTRTQSPSSSLHAGHGTPFPHPASIYAPSSPSTRKT